jgi:hypothetical protein
MIPAIVNLTVARGANYSKGFQWIDKATSQPRDLTGCTFKMQVRAAKTFPASPILAEYSTANGKIIAPQAVIGKWLLDLEAADTLACTFPKAVYDIDVTFPGLDVLTPVEGYFNPALKVTL